MPKRMKSRLQRIRKLRGMEVAQAVLLLVIGVAAGIALFLVMTGMISSTPTPRIQLDPYNSKVLGTTARVVLKFGEDVRTISTMQILDANGATVSTSCSIPSGPFRAGYSYEFTCGLSQPSMGGRLVVRMVYIAGDGSQKTANLEWMLG